MGDGWDDSGAAAWQPDNAQSAAGGWNTGDGFDNGGATEGFSTNDAGADGGCRICGQDGHFARECPDKKPNAGECYNCGQEGHNKADCPNPRVEREFTGTCRICEQPGHRASDCPDKPPALCKVCKEEGHDAKECSVNRVHAAFVNLNLENTKPQDAWPAMIVADKDKDIEDIKKAIFTYSKLHPDATLPQLEQMLRAESMNTHLIAKQQEISDTHTIVNLQGKTEQKYVVSFQFTAKPRRTKFAEGWPSSEEENLARLAEAGFVMDAFVTKCTNCNEIGHVARNCEQEKRQNEHIVTCANCEATGHRARDCPEPRKTFKKGCRICEAEDHMAKECPQRQPSTCRNCDEEGHRAAECPNERVIKCRNCDEVGHTAKECEKPRDMTRVKCNNCDEMGHVGRECPKPRDWSRVKCTNCEQMGHTFKRCPNEAKDTGDTQDNGGWGNAEPASGNAAGGDWGDSAAKGGESSWGNTAIAAGGSGGW